MHYNIIPSTLWWVGADDTNYYNLLTYRTTFGIIIIITYNVRTSQIDIVTIILITIDDNHTCWSISADRFILRFRIKCVNFNAYIIF